MSRMGLWGWITGRGKKRVEEARRQQDADKLRRQSWYETDRQAPANRRKAEADEQRAFRLLQEIDSEEAAAKRQKSDERASKKFAELAAKFEWTDWYDLNSSNLDRCRYMEGDGLVQIVYKDGSCYEYSGVEPKVWHGLLTTHSPGQYRWYVFGDPRLGGGYYPYHKVSSGESVTPARADRFSGEPFAIPGEIEKILNSKNRIGAVPRSTGVVPPPPGWVR